MKQDGKTLVELIVVLSIIGMGSAMAGPNLLGLHSRVQMRSVTDEIASEFRLARQLATTHRDRVRMAFDFDRQTLETQFVNGAITHHVYHFANKGVVIDEPSVGSEIVFYPSGRSATATTIWLHAKEGQSQKVTVAITGRVAVQ